MHPHPGHGGGAEPLESGIAQVLADKLAPELGERITVFPWRGGVARVLDYQVAVVVLRFEGSCAQILVVEGRVGLSQKPRHTRRPDLSHRPL